ncbi:MAG: helix-turn-helix domain-containing protein [Solirubrobacteraceae bacterium]
MQHDPSDWLARRRVGAARHPEANALHIYLLDADDELAQQFDVRLRLAVRQGTTIRVLDAPAGGCELGPALDRVRDGFGLLLIDGLVVRETALGGRAAAELLGAGDLLQGPGGRDEAMLEREERWRALWPARFGLLDAEFAERVRPWPQITRAILRRAGRRAAELNEVRAISSHPRLEVRLDLLFWHLAARWGRVEPGGIRLTLPLTHRLLGELVAAERPSICNALSRLSAAGLVTGPTGDWHLVGACGEHLRALLEDPVPLSARSGAAKWH